MFTKNNNTYLFPSPPLHPHHHPDIFSGHHYNMPALPDLHRHHHSPFLNNQDDPAAVENKQPTPLKKDRHSKIFTSQGPRDRRVRLSIGIARKFFDLQETLGFDKPSKTLDWLLTKSKAAIKDLVQTKEKHGDDHNNDDNSPVTSECEPGKSGNKNKGVVAAPSSSSLAKESRAKARARARERTREKMCIKEKMKGGEPGPFGYNPNPVGVFHEEVGQQSVLTRRKTSKNPNTSFFGFQQNVFVSGSGYGGGFGNENLDVCSFTSILDQHKYFMSSSGRNSDM